MKCPAHGGEGRKGVKVLFVPLKGKPRTAIVCSTCAARGVVIVTQRVPCKIAGCREPAVGAWCETHGATVARMGK